MPVQATDIDQEIAYILTYWIQNNNQLINGTIGQSVVWNLAEFIKQNPENYQKATIVASNSNYTTNKDQCYIIFTNNSSGNLNWVDNRWNIYRFANQTNNIRALSNGKFYYDINGSVQTTIPARSTVWITKATDDFWYQINESNFSFPILIGIAGRGGVDDPVVGSMLFESTRIIGLGSTNIIDGKNCIEISVNKNPENNYQTPPDFDYDPIIGIIDRDPIVYEELDTIRIWLKQ